MPRPSLLQVVVVLLVALLGLMAVSAAYRARSNRETTAATRQAAPKPAPTPEVVVPDAPPLKATPAVAATPAPAHRPVPKPAPKPNPPFAIAGVPPGGTAALHSSPGGPVVARVPSTAEFGSPPPLAVAVTRGRWVGMTSTGLP